LMTAVKNSNADTRPQAVLAWRFEPVYVNLQTLNFRIESARRQT
jgi:hypothetical protein